MPVGWGKIPIAKILSTLTDTYCGMFMMELRSRYFNSIIESKKNLEKILRSFSFEKLTYHGSPEASPKLSAYSRG
jgi:hypothetical protein